MDYKLTQAEEKLADLLWQNAPLSSTALVKQTAAAWNWKKSTTYTVLKKLCEKGVFANENARVTPVLTKEQYTSGQSRRYIEDSFGGSLPRFLASFIGGGKLSAKQAEELLRLIDAHKEEQA